VEITGESTTLAAPAFTATKTPSSNSIAVDIVTSIETPGPCTGTVVKTTGSVQVLNCADNTDCSACKSFTVSNLEPSTSYTFDITGTAPGVEITGESTTLAAPAFTATKTPSSNSIAVDIVTSIETPGPCTGTVVKTTGSVQVFNCAENTDCSACKSFTVTSLEPSTSYTFDITGTAPGVEIKGESTTTAATPTPDFSSTKTPTDTTIEVEVTTSLADLACSGVVTKKEGNETVFTCGDDAECKLCKSFNVTNLTPQTVYVFYINGNQTGVSITGEEATLAAPFFSSTFTSTDTTITAAVTTNIPGAKSCTGTVKKTSDSTSVLDCATDASCRACETFTVSGLTQNTEYTFSITGDNELYKIQGDFTTLRTKSFVSSNLPTSTRIFVTIQDNLPPPLSCSGQISETTGGTSVFTCADDDNCKQCRSFSVPSLQAATSYTLAVTSNATFGITGDVTTQAPSDFEAGFLVMSRNISVQIVSTLTEALTCTGTVKDVDTKQTVFTCENDAQCKLCTSFVVPNLVNNTQYIFAITGSQPSAKIEGTVKTTQENYFTIDAVPGETSVDVTMDSSYAGLSCTGNLVNVATSQSVFDCTTDFNCNNCRSFSIPNLNQSTEYNVQLAGNFPGWNFEKKVATNKSKTLDVVGIAVGVSVGGVVLIVAIALGVYFGMKKKD